MRLQALNCCSFEPCELSVLVCEEQRDIFLLKAGNKTKRIFENVKKGETRTTSEGILVEMVIPTCLRHIKAEGNFAAFFFQLHDSKPVFSTRRKNHRNAVKQNRKIQITTGISTSIFWINKVF